MRIGVVVTGVGISYSDDTEETAYGEIDVEVVDGSRIHNEDYKCARKMTVEALEYDKLAELNLDAIAEELERQGFGNKQITFYDIRNKLNATYKDQKVSGCTGVAFTPPNEEEVFNVMSSIVRAFTVGSREEKHLKYTGFEIIQSTNQILVSQRENVRKMNIREPLDKKKESDNLIIK